MKKSAQRCILDSIFVLFGFGLHNVHTLPGPLSVSLIDLAVSAVLYVTVFCFVQLSITYNTCW